MLLCDDVCCCGMMCVGVWMCVDVSCVCCMC
jgi:hypothetical protein